MTNLSFANFEAAGKAVLSFLYERIGFKLWMITRTEQNDWIVLQTADHGYDVQPGTVFRWADSFCSEMVKGNGPRIAPNSDDVPAYLTAPIGQQVPIKSYIGVPLTYSDGSLFGTLCAIDPVQQPEALHAELELIELLAALLSTVLNAELETLAQIRRSEILALESQTDIQTELLNRRAWDQMLAKEQDRCQRYGHPAAIFVIDLNGLKKINDTQGHAAGDIFIAKAAKVLKENAREGDVVARLGGDEFGILAVECDYAGAETLLLRLKQALKEAAVSASIGVAVKAASIDLKSVWDAADQLMYTEKRT